MRISSCLLLCFLSASLVSGIAILDAPRSDIVPGIIAGYDVDVDAGVDADVDSDVDAGAIVDSGVDAGAVVDSDADSDSDSGVDDSSSRRRLLHKFIPKVIHRIFVSPAPKPAPKPAPAPAPKPAPAPAPKPAAAAPKPVPVPTPKPAAAAPKPVPVPAPKPAAAAPKPVAAPTPKPAAAPTPTPKPAAAPTPKPAVAPVVASNVVKSVSATGSVLPIYMTCDNEFDLYVNGVKFGRGNSWTTTYYFAPFVNPGDVIAIDGVDKGGPAAFIGVFGGKVSKASDWRCSTKESTGWAKNIFDDSSWAKSVSYGRNQDANIWRSVAGGPRPNIPGDAEWLWTSDNNSHDRVFCRYFPMLSAPVAPAVVAVVAPVVVAVVAPKPASALIVAPKPASAPVAVVAMKRAVIDEIIATNAKTNAKLTKFQKKLLDIMKETSDEQLKIENENRNNYNGVSVTLQSEQVRLEASRLTMKKLYDEIERLNTTIQTHYKKLIADTNYLQSLDSMRPAFLKSLGELVGHIQAVKMIVDQKLVKDEYKNEMIGVLTDIHFTTQNVSGYVATAFINHYNKYKNLIQKENGDYTLELARLTKLANEYKVQVQKTADIEKERVRLQDLLAKLKDTLGLSISQREEFDLLVKEVLSIFDKKRC